MLHAAQLEASVRLEDSELAVLEEHRAEQVGVFSVRTSCSAAETRGWKKSVTSSLNFWGRTSSSVQLTGAGWYHDHS